MKPHKHAEILRAIADGVPLEEFDIRCNDPKTDWDKLQDGYSAWFYHPEQWEIRRKPQYIMVNGFKVPKPLDGAKEMERVYTPALMDNQMSVCWRETDNVRTAIKRGIAHSTKEAAIAHAKAILGIDPEAE